MFRWKQYWVAAALGIMLSACGPAVQEQDSGFAQPAPAEESILIVQNDNWSAMDIYAIMGSTRSRVGSVPAGRTARLRLQWQLLARPEILLQADPVGPDRAFTFPPISIRPGTTVEMRVAHSLTLSGYTCRVAC